MTQWGLDTLFNPAKRHMDEEKRRLQSTRQQIGDSSGGKRIDLESGKVVIPRAEPDDAAAEAEASDETEAPGANDDSVAQSQPDRPVTAATKRAAARRAAARKRDSDGRAAAGDGQQPDARR